MSASHRPPPCQVCHQPGHVWIPGDGFYCPACHHALTNAHRVELTPEARAFEARMARKLAKEAP